MKFLLMTLLLNFALLAGNHSNSHSPKSLTIDFDQGQATLSAFQKNQIRELFNEVKKTGEEFDLRMVVWSDQPYPGKKQSLTENQQKLANKRIESIKGYISLLETNIDDINTYNMAKSANWFSRIFETKESQLKDMISNNQTNTELMKSEYQLIKDNGAPSKAVIVLALDD